MKNLTKVQGAKALTSKEQKEVNGGGPFNHLCIRRTWSGCPSGFQAYGNECCKYDPPMF